MPNDKIKVVWECVEATPGEIESRLNKAFEILLEAVLKKREN